MPKAASSIKKGLQEAIAHQKGKARGVKTYTPSTIDVLKGIYENCANINGV